jgi:hypothetical protein
MKNTIKEIKKENKQRGEWGWVEVAYLIDCYEKLNVASEISDGKFVHTKSQD